jgi:hypothetical protein
MADVHDALHFDEYLSDTNNSTVTEQNGSTTISSVVGFEGSGSNRRE